MKKRSDPRHKARVTTVKNLFAANFNKNKKFAKTSSTFKILENTEEIDREIAKNAPAWPISQIAPIDLAILRLAIWELLYKEPKEPYKVVVDEAVEIAKEYGNETSGGFINGVLGSIIKKKLKVKND